MAVSGPGWFTVPSFGGAAEDVLPACERLGIESVIAKRLDSVYVPGSRSRPWLKFKTAAWKEHHAPRRHEHHGRRGELTLLPRSHGRSGCKMGP
jgi:ATP-dependent DNA ligase